MPDFRPLSYVEVDLSAIAANTRAIRARLGRGVTLIAVVKANAYGHGLIPCARVMLASGADRLAVSRVSEALALRAAGIAAPILTLGYAAPDEAADAVAHDITLAVGDRPTAAALAEQAAIRGRVARLHVKVDTGMGRFGLLPEEVVPFLDWLATLSGVMAEGIFTHFATADNADKSFVHTQMAIFRQVLAAAGAAGHALPLRHAANSSAILDLPETVLNAARPGIVLYGLYPSEHVSHDLPLQPALAIRSRVARVRTLPAGASIGYDRTYIAPRTIRAALIPVGYGDGYPRLLSGQGAVLINGRRAPLIGRVAMDQFVVDVSEVGPVAQDDEVVLLGRQGADVISAEELARMAGTINYHIVTALLPRLPRVYIGG
ncbi:MAG: alanine racemase [Anaerolineae bacterium]|nr:alanine racemase [Anaerolineae bacterium]